MSAGTITPARKAAIDLVELLAQSSPDALIPADCGAAARATFSRLLLAAYEPIIDFLEAPDDLALGCAEDLSRLLESLLDLEVLSRDDDDLREQIIGRLVSLEEAGGAA